MSDDKHHYRHTLTGKVDLLTEDQASVFPNYLERVAEGAKDYAPELFKPGTVAERAAQRGANDKPETDAEETAKPADAEDVTDRKTKTTNLQEKS